MANTTTEFISSVKLRGMIPTSQTTFTEARILSLGDEELRSTIAPHVLKAKSGYYSKDYDTALVDGQASYGIPTRAMGLKLKDVKIVDANGVEHPLSYIDEEQAPDYSGTGNEPCAFYVKNNDVVLVPAPASSNGRTLRLPYFIRPNSLVVPSAAAKVQSINAGLKQVTFESIPSTFTTSQLVDFVKAKPGFDCLAIDQAIDGISGSTVTFTASLPSGLAVGDWCALAGEAPVVQLPLELHPCLAIVVAVIALRALGHHKAADNLEKDLYGDGTPKKPGKMHDALSLLSPRVDGAPKKVIATRGVLNPQGSSNWMTRPQ